MKAVLARRGAASAPAASLPAGADTPLPPRPEMPAAKPPASVAAARAPEGPPSIFNHSRFDHEPASVPGDAFAPQKMLNLAAWPEMRALPAEQLLPVARICALLAHSPSVGFLVHRRLGLPREEVMALLFHLHGQGCIRVSGGDVSVSAAPDAPDAPDAADAPGPDAGPEPAGQAPRARSSIWTRMLERLLH